MKLADYVVEFLVDQGIRHVFVISGGAIVHCIDAITRNPNIEYICLQHEQGAGAAADAYARVSNNIGAVMVTSGPGATNLVTSVCNAYFDSIPTIFISGQVATFRLRPNDRMRQKGFQETDVVSIFRSITKYACQLQKAPRVKYELQKAVHLARSGRPGPVFIDIPDDLQRMEIDPENLPSFQAEDERPQIPSSQTVEQLFSLMNSARRPVLILGAGVRIANQEKEAMAFARQFSLPVFLTWGAMDVIPSDDPLNMGGLGVVGPRAGNFAAQNSDLVIALGTRLSQMITGGKQNLFAPHAKKVMVDIDAEELNKFTADDFTLDMKVQCHLADFFKICQPLYSAAQTDHCGKWRQRIREWRQRYPICPAAYYERQDRVDAHVFIKELSRAACAGAIIITDTGGNLSWTMQAFDVKKDQRLFSAWNHSPMGFSLPAAVGAALAGEREVLCLIGDGGLMMCMQELGTVRRYDLPVKIFIFNNHGHGIQKQTLDTWLNSNYAAVDQATGLYFPDFMKLGETFELPTFTIDNHVQLKERLKTVLSMPGPVLCNVEIVEDQKIRPMLKFGAGLEDLDPKIPDQELKDIMSPPDGIN
jgi:acetolactate synthase-1/2/3 large subunit